jgi:hypothetical protein
MERFGKAVRPLVQELACELDQEFAQDAILGRMFGSGVHRAANFLLECRETRG